MGEHRLRVACRAALLSLVTVMGTGHAAAPARPGRTAQDEPLAAWAPAVARQGLRLTIRAANGNTVHFESRHPANDGPEATQLADYRLAGVTRDGKFFVVTAEFYESETTYWVSRASGQKVEVFAPPEVSPDGRHAVTALHTEAYGPSGVFVWEIAGNRLVQRAHIENRGYGLFTFKRWTGNGTAELELFSHSYLNFCPGAQNTTAKVRLTRGSAGWAITPPAGARDVRCE